jgi:transcriptional regulator with XRE-family HTH domain
MTNFVVLKKLQSLMIDLMTNIDAIFAKNLVKYRKAGGYNSADSFAEVVELSLRTLQRYEAGERLPSSEKIEEMARKLGVRPQDFFKVDEAIVIEKKPEIIPAPAIIKMLTEVPGEAWEFIAKLDRKGWEEIMGAMRGYINDRDEEKAKAKS